MNPRPPLIELYRKLSRAKELNRKGRKEETPRVVLCDLCGISLRPLRLSLLATLPQQKERKILP
jgi:hypothetical protein